MGKKKGNSKNQNRIQSVECINSTKLDTKHISCVSCRLCFNAFSSSHTSTGSYAHRNIPFLTIHISCLYIALFLPLMFVCRNMAFQFGPFLFDVHDFFVIFFTCFASFRFNDNNFILTNFNFS